MLPRTDSLVLQSSPPFLAETPPRYGKAFTPILQYLWTYVLKPPDRNLSPVTGSTSCQGQQICPQTPYFTTHDLHDHQHRRHGLFSIERDVVQSFEGPLNSKLQHRQPMSLFKAGHSPLPAMQSSRVTQESPPHFLSSPTSRFVQHRQHIPDNKLPILAKRCPVEDTQSILGHTRQESDALNFALQNGTVVAQGIQLISPSQLSDKFRQLFPFDLFNPIQSKCFASVYHTNENVVVSAPTGSGKTVILELAICKLIEGHPIGQFKIVYQAPTKSLCSERFRDWQKKFSHLNLNCAELTGDTDVSEMRTFGNATIIVTTPEKWDSITRKWKDCGKLLQMVKLFLIDEVHILKDVRGATLEAVVSRMKSSSARVRFLALSATIPNSKDISKWLGRDYTNHQLPAHQEEFGEEFRPVKLQKHVYGFDNTLNDFCFDTMLDTKLPALIRKHSEKKPIMVFCFTRNSCEATARKLANWWSISPIADQEWPAPSNPIFIGNTELKELVSCGVAFHHGGLDPQDRTTIETGYVKGQIGVICCTSTLAVGVNLPCHLVVIKGTAAYQDGGLAEYSDLEVMQMLGRAGRPQFGSTAIAIVMTRSSKVNRYQQMISGQDVLESTLHLSLIEHLNSEVGLGNVHNIYSAKVWIASTFLSVRMRENPSYYKFSSDIGTRDADERLERVCENGIGLLQSTKLITEGSSFVCTAYGEAMSRYMISFETMKLLLTIPEHAKIGQILQILCQAIEFKDFRLKPIERGTFRNLNNSPFIKFPIKEVVATFAHKVSLILQTQLGGIDLPVNKEFKRLQYQSEKSVIFDRIQRLVRCVVDLKAYDGDGQSTLSALELSRSISAGYWEEMPVQLRQIPNVGPATVKKLIQSNINSVEQLAKLDSAGIERVMSRNPPFGKKLLDILNGFPHLTLHTEIVGRVIKGQEHQAKLKARIGFTNSKAPFWKNRSTSVTFVAAVGSGKLAHFWRGNLKKLERGIELAFMVQVLKVGDKIKCVLACDEIVGTVQSVSLTPDFPSSSFPSALKTIASPSVTDYSKLATEDNDSDFGLNDVDEEALLCVVKEVEASSIDDGGGVVGSFVNIEDLYAKLQHDDATHESLRMKNGRWTCNHKCNDGRRTRKGGTCKHQCCHEGLSRPRKLARKNAAEDEQNFTATISVNKKAPSSLRLKRIPSNLGHRGIEIVDLADHLSSSAKLASGDYDKLQNLYIGAHSGGNIRLPKQSSLYSYATGGQVDLAFLSGGVTDESGTGHSSPEGELPSVSTVVGDFTRKPTLEVADNFQSQVCNLGGYFVGESNSVDHSDINEPKSAHDKVPKRASPVIPEHVVKRQRMGDEIGRNVSNVVEERNEDELLKVEWTASEDATLIAEFSEFVDFI